MLSQQEASQIIYEEINKPDLYWPDKPEMVILEEFTVKKEYGWIFFYDSSLWLETNDFRHALAGNGPILISKLTGKLYMCGSAPPVEERIREQEQKLAFDLAESR